jgi:hypothetical protein
MQVNQTALLHACLEDIVGGDYVPSTHALLNIDLDIRKCGMQMVHDLVYAVTIAPRSGRSV